MMFVVWFEVNGLWHWVEIFHQGTADIVREALAAQGYKVSETSEDPRKYSMVNQGAK